MSTRGTKNTRCHPLARSRVGAPLALALLGASAGCAPADRLADPAETHLGAAASPLKWHDPEKLVAGDLSSYAHLGTACALSEDTALVGAPLTAQSASGDAAFVFVRESGGWVQQKRLAPAGVTAEQRFGVSVALLNDTALVGTSASAAASVSGSAYVFVRSGATWSPGQKLVAGDGGLGNAFGNAVALSGDVAFVAAPLHAVGPNAEQGAVHVFRKTGADWIEQPEMITAPDGEAGDRFGLALAAAGDTLVVGASQDQNDAEKTGSAYVFVSAGAGFELQQKLTPPPGVGEIAFGAGVAISGDTVAVGAPELSDLMFLTGAVYVFEREGAIWSEPTRLGANEAENEALLGRGVAVSADLVVAGAPFADTAQKDGGAVFVFGRAGGGWQEEATLTLPDAAASDNFGSAPAVWGHTVLAGAAFSDAEGKDSGAAYVFEPLLENGAPCAGGAQCASNYCIDAVCCDALCLEADMACSAATKGSGEDGVCGPVVGGGGQGGGTGGGQGGGTGGGQTESTAGQTSNGDPGGDPGGGSGGAERSYYSCAASSQPWPPGAGFLGVALAVILASRARRRRSAS